MALISFESDDLNLPKEQSFESDDLNLPKEQSSATKSQIIFSIAILFLMNAMSTLDKSVFAILVPEMQADLGLNDFQISVLQGVAFSGSYVLFGLLMAGLIDRGPRKMIVFCGVTVWSLAATLCGAASSFSQLFLARMSLGAGESMISPTSQSLLSDMVPRERLTSAISVTVVAGSAVGAGVAFFAGGLLLQLFETVDFAGLAAWRMVYLVTGAPGLLLGMLAFFVFEPKSVRAKTKGAASLKAFSEFLRGNKRLYGCLICAFAFGAVIPTVLQAWGPTYGRRVLELSAVDVGNAFALVFAFGTLIGVVSVGLIVDRLISRGVVDGALRVYGLALVVSVPICIAAFEGHSTAMYYTGLVVTNMLLGASFGPAFAAIQMISEPQFRGRMAVSMLLISTLIGGGCGPMAVGLLTDRLFADRMMLGEAIAIVCGVAGLLSLALLCVAAKPFRQRFENS